ncbi:transcriptional regulator SgrR, partial [Escherichia coli]|nr:transcriptional regulator SgrR [Escherichia coli]
EISYDQWHEGEIESDIWLNSANFTLPLDFSLFAHLCVVPLIHHWLIIQGQRSMRGLRMNTLGWFDFKSAWFAP